MSKIHLEIEIPGNAKTYEFVLDDRMKIGTAKEQIKKQKHFEINIMRYKRMVILMQS